MKIKFTTTAETAAALKGADANNGSSLAVMSGFAHAPRIRAAFNSEHPVKSYTAQGREITDGMIEKAKARGLGIEGAVVLSFFHSCAPRQKTFKRLAATIRTLNL
jgi:hypothetical protein